MLEQLEAKLLADVTACANELRAGFNAILAKLRLEGIAYGRSSIVKLHFGGRPGVTVGEFGRARDDAEALMTGTPTFDKAFERAIVLEGVDRKATTGFVSAAHGSDEVDMTIAAFERALGRALATVGDPGGR